jgi:hypothetical protein
VDPLAGLDVHHRRQYQLRQALKESVALLERTLVSADQKTALQKLKDDFAAWEEAVAASSQPRGGEDATVSVHHDDDNDSKPVWPTWAGGALFRGEEASVEASGGSDDDRIE